MLFTELELFELTTEISLVFEEPSFIPKLFIKIAVLLFVISVDASLLVK
jgi:hypothetical protein